MALTTGSFSTEQRDQSGELGPYSSGPGAGSTKAMGNTAGQAPVPAGNSAGTGHQGVPATPKPDGTVVKNLVG